jgi:antitoxin MazE
MKASVVAIGNSQGIRLPKALLELCHIKSQVDLEVRDDAIIIHPVRRKPRKGWLEAFKQMNSRGEDKLLMDDSLDLEMKDWQW